MYRKVAAAELAKLLSIISHPDRILIIEELNQGELDVTAIQERLKISQSTTSRHLAIMKAQNIVAERKEGRRVFYHLTVPVMAQWLIEGLDIIGKKTVQEKPLSKAFAAAKKMWTVSGEADG
ncbi:MAG: HTH-type transcriptional repressor SmtB [Pseudomonadota bacterium]|jgi:DNA-binding transcriptional ArsR family regulator